MDIFLFCRPDRRLPRVVEDSFGGHVSKLRSKIFLQSWQVIEKMIVDHQKPVSKKIKNFSEKVVNQMFFTNFAVQN